MKTIFKYPLFGNGTIKLPAGAEVLSAGEQAGGIVVWARVDTDKLDVPRRFEVVGTGWEDRDGGAGKLINTVQQHNGMVFHVFDHGEVPQ